DRRSARTLAANPSLRPYRYGRADAAFGSPRPSRTDGRIRSRPARTRREPARHPARQPVLRRHRDHHAPPPPAPRPDPGGPRGGDPRPGDRIGRYPAGGGSLGGAMRAFGADRRQRHFGPNVGRGAEPSRRAPRHRVGAIRCPRGDPARRRRGYRSVFPRAPPSSARRCAPGVDRDGPTGAGWIRTQRSGPEPPRLRRGLGGRARDDPQPADPARRAAIRPARLHAQRARRPVRPGAHQRRDHRSAPVVPHGRSQVRRRRL
ncbi:MAG: hypothetical protein AVDCRST_MAG73-4271, partial [uncultured Thermomicrobiales bacterium]